MRPTDPPTDPSSTHPSPWRPSLYLCAPLPKVLFAPNASHNAGAPQVAVGTAAGTVGTAGRGRVGTTTVSSPSSEPPLTSSELVFVSFMTDEDAGETPRSDGDAARWHVMLVSPCTLVQTSIHLMSVYHVLTSMKGPCG